MNNPSFGVVKLLDFSHTMDYFVGLFGSPEIDAKLLLTLCGASGETMAASVFTISANIVQYHLGGTLTRFMGRMPSKLLIDEMRIPAVRRQPFVLQSRGRCGMQQR